MIDFKLLTANLRRSAEEITLSSRMKRRQDATYEPLSGKEDGVVVSLSSFPKRLPTLWMVIDSLFRQTVRPDKIVLVLTDQEIPEGLDALPESLKKFQQYGLEIVFTPYNYLCHNKYFYTFQAYPDAKVITVDDDCYYSKNTIKRLLELNREYPNTVCCNIAARINLDNFYHYRAWKKNKKAYGPSDLNMAAGFGGVLYPPHLFPNVLFDHELFTRISPIADDLWLKAIEIVSNIKVACGDFYTKPVTIKGSQVVSLRSINKGTENRNDIQWRALDEHFQLINKIKWTQL